ncbi:MAG: hypothetical protein J6X44_09865 [Thermoguttaceae bacterium]|nr:hypothetical protein [Thermoguttaceae bacterium]
MIPNSVKRLSLSAEILKHLSGNPQPGLHVQGQGNVLVWCDKGKKS